MGKHVHKTHISHVPLIPSQWPFFPTKVGRGQRSGASKTQKTQVFLLLFCFALEYMFLHPLKPQEGSKIFTNQKHVMLTHGFPSEQTDH